MRHKFQEQQQPRHRRQLEAFCVLPHDEPRSRYPAWIYTRTGSTGYSSAAGSFSLACRRIIAPIFGLQSGLAFARQMPGVINITANSPVHTFYAVMEHLIIRVCISHCPCGSGVGKISFCHIYHNPSVVATDSFLKRLKLKWSLLCIISSKSPKLYCLGFHAE